MFCQKMLYEDKGETETMREFCKETLKCIETACRRAHSYDREQGRSVIFARRFSTLHKGSTGKEKTQRTS